ncbi:hypothetical protein MYX78_10860 [Acidobacteria bacterium AH-259-G07]|nr:hypothetical protein [Acidobacteria bacterium AH-259-G07]
MGFVGSREYHSKDEAGMPKGGPMSVRKFVTLLVCLNLGVTLALAQTIGKESLRGLEGVEVLVAIGEPIVEAGLSKHQLQVDVELRLRKAGIKVLTEEERWNTPGSPFLFASVIGVRISRSETRSGYAYQMKLYLNQQVTLSRDLEKTDAFTWHTAGVIGITPRDSLTRNIREAIADMVDEFINDYLAINPKQ